ncbi:MAG TPA: efflux RND transporter periplasmic adaptor subunit [Ideonella sp.]|nr:efflux RND transporter periplasmic adaptor subunit [Ideonella sp.]
MRKVWLIGGLVVLLAAGGGAGWVLTQGSAKAAVSADGKKADKALEFTSREVVRPQLTPMATALEFSGSLVAPQTAIVRAKSSGTLLTLDVAEGSRVSAGARLGTLDLADLNARVSERGAMLEAARAMLVQAEKVHANNQRLAEAQFISPTALDSSKATLDSARAQLNAAQAQVDTVRISLREAALVAPISGIVAKRFVVPGEKVSAEQQLLSIVDLRNLEMMGSVGTHEVSQLSPGMAVQVKVEGVETPVQGTLARIAPAAEAGTRSIGVTVNIANPKEVFRAGQFALARVSLRHETPRLTVPAGAIAAASGQEYVWTLEQDKLLRRSVTTGRRDTSRGLIEILDGVKPDTQVLAARFDNLREGAPAKVVTAVAQATMAASAPASN